MVINQLTYFHETLEINIAREQLSHLKLIKPDPVSVTIDDIMSDMQREKFLVWPSYQRSEVKNIKKSNEGLITALAYLHYQTNFKRAQYLDLLTIYLRNGHVCSRISSKDRITKMLETLTPQGIKDFEVSVNAVREFVEKICIVAGMKGEKLQQILCSNRKTDQSFYFLWIALQDISKEELSNDVQLVI